MTIGPQQKHEAVVGLSILPSQRSFAHIQLSPYCAMLQSEVIVSRGASNTASVEMQLASAS